jgi:hypothetical protein
VLSMVKEGSISVSLNGESISYFNPEKGLRQEDPLSHLLFNLVVDVFIRMLTKAASKGHISRLINSVYPDGIISLQDHR